jgi:RNA 2',3'-cyclic 3'-phosphodiesterase
MRLFVAIDFPDDVKDRVSALKAEIPTARWVSRDQMHLTLFFIGETERLQAVKDGLAGVKAAPFDLTLSGVGRFPPGDRKPPRVIWVGINPQPALNHLQANVTTALTAIGFQPEDRPYSPHLTLARLKTERLSPETAQFLAAHQAFQTISISISAFTLYSSALSSEGAHYTHEAVYALSG